MDVLQVRRATPADGGGAAATLAEAFSTDPLMTWLLGGVPDVEPRLRLLFTSELAGQLDRGGHAVDVVADGSAVALWYDVGAWRASPLEVLQSTPAMVRVFGRRVGLAFRAFAVIEDAHPEEPHRYLEALGVRRSAQGQGRGSALLAAACQRLDRDRLPAYLENTNPRNEPLYVRHGFEAVRTIRLPGDGPSVVAMWRAPRRP